MLFIDLGFHDSQNPHPDGKAMQAFADKLGLNKKQVSSRTTFHLRLRVIARDPLALALCGHDQVAVPSK